jgi:hypothetical protein
MTPPNSPIPPNGEAAGVYFDTMVGNKIGTSLAMAPAFLVGQLCSVVDLDGPLFLRSDRTHPVHYDGGLLQCPPQRVLPVSMCS